MDAQDKIIAFLLDTRTASTTREIADGSGLKVGTTRSALAELARVGGVQKIRFTPLEDIPCKSDTYREGGCSASYLVRESKDMGYCPNCSTYAEMPKVRPVITWAHHSVH